MRLEEKINEKLKVAMKSKDKILNFEKNRKETRPWIFINE